MQGMIEEALGLALVMLEGKEIKRVVLDEMNPIITKF